MKSNFLFCMLLASLAMIAGCQKEKEFVELDAVIDHSTKTYIDGDNYPCWIDDDEIRINEKAYVPESVNGTYAHFTRVTVSQTNGYRAVYPAGIVTSTGNISRSNTVQVSLPRRQKYVTFGTDNQQRVEIPMGAYTEYNATRNTLQFHNLCSIVRVTVTNDINPTAPDPNGTNNRGVMKIQKISLDANHTLLSGDGTATINGNSNDNISLTSGYKYVTLSLSNPELTMKTLNNGQTAVFDIVVPAFGSPATKTGDDVVLTIKCSTGIKKYTFENVYLNSNSIVPLVFNVQSLDPMPAELLPGDSFNSAIRGLSSNIQDIEFVCDCTVPDGVTTVHLEKSAPANATNTPTPIYGYMDGTTLKVCTPAKEMYSNGSCQHMFANLTNLQSVSYGEGFSSEYTTSMQGMFQYSGITTTANLGLANFRTESVTNMQEMFRGCTSLVTVELPSSFDFSSVTSMWSMFSECTHLVSVTFPENINTESLTNMQAMFQSCSSLTVINNLSKFETGKVYTMYSTFRDCSSLTALDLSTFNTESVTTMQSMFYNCNKLTSLDVSNFSTRLVTTMEEMFQKCEKLQELDLSSFNTQNVTNMKHMFADCKDMGKDNKILDLSNFDMSNIQYYGAMCNQLAANRPGGDYKCTIVCSSPVETMMSNSNSNINLNKVRFVRTRPTTSK